MPSQGVAALFDTKGQLLVKVIEVSCSSFESALTTSIDTSTGKKKLKKSVLPSSLRSLTSAKSAYLTVDVSLRNGDDSLIYQTACPPVYCSLLPTHGNGSSLVGEEYVFNDVLSTSLLCLTLLFDSEKVDVSPSRRANQERGILGIIDIPISRLESDKAVSQWYQLQNPLTGEGLKSAIRIEVLYSEDPEGIVPIPLSADNSPAKRSSIITDDSVIIDDSNENNTNGSQVENPENEPVVEMPSPESKRLPTGIVDDIVIVGPEENSITCTPSIKSPSQPSSSLWDSQKSTPISPTVANSRQSIVWDRFPKQDYPDNPLPEKIEWFVSPQGPETICSATRPEHNTTSFVLSAGDNTGQLYVVRLRYFINIGECDCKNKKPIAIPKSPKANNNSTEGHIWWIQPGDIISDQLSLMCSITPRKTIIEEKILRWISVDISFLSRWSFVDQLSQCLEHLYTKIILPATISHESKVNDWTGIPPVTLNLDQVMIALCFECPAPVPDLYSVTMNLWGLFPSAPTLKMNDITGENPASSLAMSTRNLENLIPSFTVDFRLSPSNSLPVCPYPLVSVLELLGPRTVVDIVCCVLSENRILFHSNDLSKLPILCESFVTLIYPMKWSHVYLPVVPASLLDLVEAPVPFLLGTHSSWLQYLSSECLSDVVLIDCDSGCIDYHSVSPMIFPDDIDRWLVLALKHILMSFNTTKNKIETSLQLQIVIFDVLVALLKDVPQCLFYLDRNTPIFNRALYLSEFTHSKYQKCVKILSDTNAFHRFTDGLNTYRLQYFVECVERFPLADASDFEVTPLIVHSDSQLDSSSDKSSSNFSSSNQSISPSGRNISPLWRDIGEYGSAKQRPLFFSHAVLSPTHKQSFRHSPEHISPSHRQTAVKPISRTQFPVSPMRSLFHSTFKAKDIEDIIKSTESDEYNDPSFNLESPSISKNMARRISFNRQRSFNKSNSFKIENSNETESQSPPDKLDTDLDVIFAQLEPKKPPDSQSKSISIPKQESEQAHVESNTSILSDDYDFDDGSLPGWIMFGKNFNKEMLAASKTVDKIIEIDDLLQHRLSIYLPSLSNDQISRDPVLIFDLFDPTFDNHDNSAPSSTLQLSSNFISEPLSEVTNSTVSALDKSVVRRSRKFWSDRHESTDEHQSDTASVASFSRSVASLNIGDAHDKLVSKRLVLHRPSIVTGVSLNITHEAKSNEDMRPRSFNSFDVDMIRDGSLTARSVSEKSSSDRDSHHVYLAKHSRSDYSSDFQKSTHSIESIAEESETSQKSNSIEGNNLAILALQSTLGSDLELPFDAQPFERTITETSLPSASFAPVIFDYRRLSESMNQVNVWTLADLSTATGVSIDELIKKYADTVEKDLCTSDFSIMYNNSKSNSKVPDAADNSKSGKRRRTSTISNRFVGSKTSSTLTHWLDSSPSHQACGANILDYLKIVISGLEIPYIDFQAVKQLCYEELKIFKNRGALIQILKQSHSEDTGKGVNGEDFPTFFPLHAQAFQSMTSLFQDILSLCTQQHDYLHAYDLLVAGGLYFNVGDKDDTADNAEFLNLSIKHHPIYQKPELWLAVLKSRLDASSSTHTSPSGTGTIKSIPLTRKDLPLPSSPKTNEQVILETHAMLYMMHSLGVNPERAMLFIQQVVELYRLDLKFFVNLKLFLDRLWPSHKRLSLVTRDRSSADNEGHRINRFAGLEELKQTDKGLGSVDHATLDSKESNPPKVEEKPVKKSWFRWRSSK